MRDEALATKVQGVVQMCRVEEGGIYAREHGKTTTETKREEQPFKANERRLVTQ